MTDIFLNFEQIGMSQKLSTINSVTTVSELREVIYHHFLKKKVPRECILFSKNQTSMLKSAENIPFTFPQDPLHVYVDTTLQ